ncbi:hypothetical protein [Herbaspirillum rubrisubalbicans]|uniref:hypothetical protein n=1 Tax=Herbaspirillum rubrisubalbicans TaxID=80842 RepID=UPI0015C55775|nr:hypothetical protein [Herbaspirillum rubrisubalbicans]
MAQHELRTLAFASLTAERWDSFPETATISKQIGDAILAQSEVSGDHVGFYNPPDEIKEVKVTVAALDQIQCMWHGHRQPGRRSPPAIPLRYFVTGFGQENGKSWASVEVYPGVDNWEAS